MVWTPPAGSSAVLTVDSQVEGVHFQRQWLSAGEIGERAVTASASDLAAMGARPVGILVALILEKDLPERRFRAIYGGILRGASRYGLRILGGNLSAGPLSLTITSVGEGDASRLVGRGGARSGDELWVTGVPGLARLGLQYLRRGFAAARAAGRPASASARTSFAPAVRAFRRPTARVREALEIVTAFRPTAMIDLSDGLAADLAHILEESGRRLGRTLGADVHEAPFSGMSRLRQLAAALGEHAAEAALSGGEDYELLFSTRARRGKSPPGVLRVAGIAVTRIGRIVEERGIRLIGADGSRRRMPEHGWDHFE